jgi:peroxiredoxin Q/BCP
MFFLEPGRSKYSDAGTHKMQLAYGMDQFIKNLPCKFEFIPPAFRAFQINMFFRRYNWILNLSFFHQSNIETCWQLAVCNLQVTAIPQEKIGFYIRVMATHLREGMKAPAFTGTDQDGNKISLKDFKGKSLVLFFYPEDDTPTCTIQACNLRDHHTLLRKKGFEIIGISPDTEKDHVKFRNKFNLPFLLIADPEHKIIDKYGVWGEKLLYGRRYMGLHRTTFVIDEKGLIKRIFLRPKNKTHAEEILNAQ